MPPKKCPPSGNLKAISREIHGDDDLPAESQLTEGTNSALNKSIEVIREEDIL
jgi:hypothetical protein